MNHPMGVMQGRPTGSATSSGDLSSLPLFPLSLLLLCLSSFNSSSHCCCLSRARVLLPLHWAAVSRTMIVVARRGHTAAPPAGPSFINNQKSR